MNINRDEALLFVDMLEFAGKTFGSSTNWMLQNMLYYLKFPFTNRSQFVTDKKLSKILYNNDQVYEQQITSAKQYIDYLKSVAETLEKIVSETQSWEDA